ncbi:L-threonylcarbamoyladenylate synthase [Coraliomargarita sp. SDUM461003]|uniref:Threonylcarbamoyl-AMP synthase n=1 Tax=Thalassobacterium maritimum TaxID=3041265 RepID=A0ABU1ATH9_9BACT|nr:L-threonylcarbamoyladenylate synthase [Coraliomargarita sp. SDUM461003]MDQ8207477.1 L-threonylcarbamoyladenylate synthase [Coraliomargarita sp. SDUM461003]
MTHACKILPPTEANIDLCADLLRDEAVVGVPTETVYGLAGNALNEVSVRKIFEVKGRPLIDPLIVHFHSLEDAEAHVEFNDRARKLAAQFWPGALTLILPKKDSISDLVTAGLPSAAVRVPAHPVFRSLLKRLEFPLAAPSANPFGYVSPTLAQHVDATLGNRILAVLDGGACDHGVESTIVDLRDPAAPKILRPGPLSAEALGIQNCIQNSDTNKATVPITSAQAAPGMLTQHYSPKTPITLFAHGTKAQQVKETEAVIYTVKPCDSKLASETSNTFWLSENGELAEIAHNLFGLIQKLDQAKYTRLHIERALNQAIGVAVNDRLSRAAAKRP